MNEVITRDMVINDVIKKYPQTIAIFNRFRVDSCCGGGVSIEKTATRDGVDVDALITALNDEVAGTVSRK
jgi:regulator of cell morphogenesis and NO signaling